jgi:chromosome segregation ATPase
MGKTTFALLALAVRATDGAEMHEVARHHANPIRKVVTMLQNLKTKVEAEGEKERELHEKYMCYCKNGAATLEKGIADAGNKLPELEAAIKEAEAKKIQYDDDVKTHQSDRAAAKTAMAEATAVREKEKGVHDKAVAESEATVSQLNKAVAAIENGMGASFLQSQTAQDLKKVVLNKANMNDGDRGELVAFLTTSADSDYAPASGEIVGILKTMGDEMTADIAELKKTEEAAVKSYDALMAAKKKEIEALTKMIEEKLKRVGELGVEIVEMKNDLGDTGEQIIEDKKFLKDLDKNCEEKAKLFGENVKMRGQEIEALADTIKVLNDDDALELFKKTLPGASSFLQVTENASQMRARALSILTGSSTHHPGVDFIVLSLQGKKAGFEKVIKLIDDLTAELKKEQQADEDKKEYCAEQFDKSEDKQKVLEKTVADHEKAIADAEESIVTLKGEIDALGDGIRALDKSVEEATAQRKEEADDYTVLMAGNTAAKELILFAKNRLNKFYNPKLYKAPPKKELSDEDRATLAAGGTLAPTEAPGGIAGTGVTVLSQEAPPPPPEAVGAYSKKSEESGGVIALMDLLVKDLDKEMTEAEFTEKDAQEDYETFMKDSSEKRAQDSKALSDKEATLADTKARLEEEKDGKESASKELMATMEYIHNLHTDCDWLIKYFDMRSEARTNEIDAMQKAKAILSGADYSFLQMGSKKLRR